MEEPNHGTRKKNEVEKIWSGGEKRRRGSEEPCNHHNEEGDGRGRREHQQWPQKQRSSGLAADRRRGLSHLPLTTSETLEEETKWRKFCRVEQMEEEEEGGNIRVCPAATTMEKATRTPAAPKMATVAGERWCAPERPTGHNRPTFLSPPARCQRRRGRVSKP